MLKKLQIILDIQELDMKMLRLLQLRQSHQDRLQAIHQGNQQLQDQLSKQKEKILFLERDVKVEKARVADVTEKLKKLEGQQSLVRKVDEFNALTQEMSKEQRELTGAETKIHQIQDVLSNEEEILHNIQNALNLSTENNKSVEEEIKTNIAQVNQEGRLLKSERDRLVANADPEVFRIYERLLCNKRDRVVVPIENRCCSGCHIVLTAQDENLVRKGERLVFCEHCSRIHYWQDSQELATASTEAPKQRRRKKAQ